MTDNLIVHTGEIIQPIEETSADINEVMPYRRENIHRVFANRNIFMDKIHHFGFDMDYTLAEYISPFYEELTYKYAVKHLTEIGYPLEIEQRPYDSRFATRGVVFDRLYGNLLKIDTYGNILNAVHGLGYIELEESRRLYRNRFIDVGDTTRFSFFNTLFEFPSMYLISIVIDYFENAEGWLINNIKTGVEKEHIQISYDTIFGDVSKAFFKIHTQRNLKQETIDNISMYIKKDVRLPLLLKRFQQSGRKTFLVTNSDYWYTNNVMNYLFKGANTHGESFSEDWKTYFDVIVVDARKPLFFAEGTAMCQIDISTGKKHIGVYKGKVSAGVVFAGGNSEVLCELLGAQGKDILYVGDHIFGDILKSKKKQGWRTYLVVPELQQEINMWISQYNNYKKVEKLGAVLSNIYKNMDSSTIQAALESTQKCNQKIRDKVVSIEKSYGVLGSVLRCGHRQTFFSGQVTRFADLYSHTCLNLLYYPFFYSFRAPVSLLPHEATINVSEKSENSSREFSPELSPSELFKAPDLSKHPTICAEELSYTDDPLLDSNTRKGG